MNNVKLSDLEKELLIEQLFFAVKTKDKVEQWLRKKVAEIEFELLARAEKDEREQVSLEEWNETLDFYVKKKHEFNHFERRYK